MGIVVPKPIRDPLAGKVLRPFQQTVMDIIDVEEPDERIIYWFWETIGNVGKTALCKHICLKYPKRVLIVNGKQSDMFNAVLSFKESTGDYPSIIIIDIPRSMINYVSWGGIEKIKDGLFYSGKYEGGQCVFNCPHVVCFANSAPNMELLSEDRWRVYSRHY